LRDPSSLNTEKLSELEEIVAEAPYFQSARMLLAKGSRMLNEPSTKRRISSAAIYATDRPLLKKYISGNLLFLTKPPEEEESASTEGKPTDESKSKVEKETTSSQGSASTKTDETEETKLFIPGIPEGALDVMLEELEHDMEDLKTSRSKFADLQKQIENRVR
jgi:hypothetical protein